MSVLDDDEIRFLARLAWIESLPGTAEAHEEGGFVLKASDGKLLVERWPRGAKNQIVVPVHSQGTRGELTIVATFHTHPSTGQGFQREPSLTDIRAIRDDADLSHQEYEGEYIISAEQVYLVRKSGDVEVVGDTQIVLNIGSSDTGEAEA
jgi:hypothetical protein